MTVVTSVPFLSNFQDVIEDLGMCHKLQFVSESSTNSSLNSCVSDSIKDTKIYLVVPKELREALLLDLPKMQKKRKNLLTELKKLREVMSSGSTKLKLETQQNNLKKVKINHLIFESISLQVISFLDCYD